MVVFQLARNMKTGALMANTVATIANDGQLPVPAGEVFDGEKPWESPNRTNIEATRYFATPPAFLRKVFSPRLRSRNRLWCGGHAVDGIMPEKQHKIPYG